MSQSIYLTNLDRLWRAARFTSSYAEQATDSESEDDFEDGLDFRNEGGEEDIAGIRRRISDEAAVSRVGETLDQTLEPDRNENAAPRDHFSPVQVRFPVNAPALRPPPPEVEDGHQPPVVAAMVDFDQENADDSATAMDNLRSVQCPFNKGDIEFWFSQLEDQLTLIGVKKQWTKKIALVRFLPPEIQNEVKSLLKLGQTAAGNNIYFRIKTKLLKQYGPKPEDAYMIAKNLVLTDKPSQLGHKLVETLCSGEIKLDGCHCARIIWGMFREKIPIVVRNHLADMTFDKDNYEAVFDKADQVSESNKGSEPLPSPQCPGSRGGGCTRQSKEE